VNAPLLVQFVFHPASQEASAVADYLHQVLNADPSVPGLKIPTCFMPVGGSSDPPAPQLASEADQVFVVLLADDVLAAAALEGGSNGFSWGEYLAQLRTITEATGQRFVPVQFTPHAFPIDSRLDDANFLPAWATEDRGERNKLIARRLVHLLIRRLRPRSGGEDAKPLTIFLSHAKQDVERDPHVVNALLDYLKASQPEAVWFDSGDISPGSRFAKAIENGLRDAALLAVVTDSYSSRMWCRKEVLLAKTSGCPVLVVDAIQEQVPRSFPYLGNTPVIRWNGNPHDVVDLLLREALRHTYAESALEQRKNEGDVILPTSPELLTLVPHKKVQSVLYPDPPLDRDELGILAHTGVCVETPLQRHARVCGDSGKNVLVGLSVSEADDLQSFGLRLVHLESVYLELSRYLLLAGVRLAYGGHLREDGYTRRLANLLHEPILESHREGPNPLQSARQLVVYQP